MGNSLRIENQASTIRQWRFLVSCVSGGGGVVVGGRRGRRRVVVVRRHRRRLVGQRGGHPVVGVGLVAGRRRGGEHPPERVHTRPAAAETAAARPGLRKEESHFIASLSKICPSYGG